MARSDEQIKRDIIDSLYWDDRVNANDVDAEVSNGIATLRGTVPSYFVRSCAADDAWAVAGVTGVRNQLTVHYPPAVALPTDDEIQSAVEDRLAFDPDIDVLDTWVQVTAGVVTLEGSVDAYWKKRHAEDIAAAVRGVTAIENRLAIVPTRDYTDQEIAADITAALERNVLVDPEEVNIRVSDGVVTLTGTVDGWAARRAAANSARNTAGVRNLRDKIAVSGVARSYG